MKKKPAHNNQLFIGIALALFVLTAVFAYIYVISERNGHVLVTEQFLGFGVLIGGTAAIGMFFLLAGTNRKKRPRAAKLAMGILFGVYLVILAGLLFGGLRNAQSLNGTRLYNLKPLGTIKMYYEAYKEHSLRYRIIGPNLVGNILLFVPMAWFVPFLFPAMRNWKLFFPSMLLLICLVEITQYLTGRGSMDIDDVILNYPGVVIGFLILWNQRMLKFWKKLGLIEKKG